jgi:protein TonB
MTILALALTLNGAVHAQTAGGGSGLPSIAVVKAGPDPVSGRAMNDLVALAVRDEIALSAKYPNSREARQLQPAGRVGLWVELDRSGSLVDARITSRSAHTLLDVEALRNVRNARYASFPAGAFSGEDSHRFTLTLEYAPSGR